MWCETVICEYNPTHGVSKYSRSFLKNMDKTFTKICIPQVSGKKQNFWLIQDIIVYVLTGEPYILSIESHILPVLADKCIVNSLQNVM